MTILYILLFTYIEAQVASVFLDSITLSDQKSNYLFFIIGNDSIYGLPVIRERNKKGKINDFLAICLIQNLLLFYIEDKSTLAHFFYKNSRIHRILLYHTCNNATHLFQRRYAFHIYNNLEEFSTWSNFKFPMI